MFMVLSSWQSHCESSPQNLYLANLNSCCVPIFQSLASTVAEINRGSQFFSDAPLAQPPPQWRRQKFLAAGALPEHYNL